MTPVKWGLKPDIAQRVEQRRSNILEFINRQGNGDRQIVLTRGISFKGSDKSEIDVNRSLCNSVLRTSWKAPALSPASLIASLYSKVRVDEQTAGAMSMRLA